MPEAMSFEDAAALFGLLARLRGLPPGRVALAEVLVHGLDPLPIHGRPAVVGELGGELALLHVGEYELPVRDPEHSPGQGHEYSPPRATSVPQGESRAFPTLFHAAPVVDDAFEFNGFSSRLQVFCDIFLRQFFANGFAFQLNLTSLMRQAIENRAGDDWIGENPHPVGHGAIAGQDN